MKKIAVILVLLSFTARPVYELGYLAYFELNIDYIIDTYCVNTDRPELNCDGKCYLMQHLAGAESTSNKDTSKTIRLIETFCPLYYQDYAYGEFRQELSIETTSNWPALQHREIRFSNVPVPPPKV